MKLIFLLVIVLPALVMGQTQSVQSTPIAISGDGLAGEAGEDEEVMRARSELSQSRIRPGENEEETPRVGELVPPLRGVIEGKEGKEGKEVNKPQARERAEPWKIELKERYLLARFGLVASSWSSLSTELDNGSTVLGFGVYQVFSDRVGASIALEFSHPMKGSIVPEENRFLNFKIEGDYVYPISTKLKAVGSMALSLTDYNIRRKIQTTESTETYRRFGDGFAFGLVPGLGLRANVSQNVFIDGKVIYPFYFSSPQKYYNGVGGQFTLHFSL